MRTSRASIPRKRQERGARRVDAIVEAAAELFAARGFDGTSMNAIAKAAGMTIGSLYQYFPNRDAVVDAVALRFLAAWRAHRDRGIAAMPTLSLRELIHFGIRHSAEFHQLHGGVKAFLDADPQRAESIRTIQEQVSGFVPVLAHFYPDRSYDELLCVTKVMSTILRAGATVVPSVGMDREALFDEFGTAVVNYIIGRLGEPLEPAGTATS